MNETETIQENLALDTVTQRNVVVRSTRVADLDMDRFLREAEAYCRIASSGVVRGIGYVRTKGSQRASVIFEELANVMTLEDLLGMEQLTPAGRTLVALDLLNGVAGLHAHGLVHGQIGQDQVWVARGRAWLKPPRALVEAQAEEVTQEDDKLALGELLQQMAEDGRRRDVLSFVIDALCQPDPKDRPGVDILLSHVFDAGDSLFEPPSQNPRQAALARLKLLGIDDAGKHLETCTDHFEAEQCVFAGADVNRRVEGEPLLITAVRACEPARVQVLVEAEADPNAVDEGGHSALWWAVDQGNASLTKYLVEAGGDPQLADQSGVTPSALAQKKGRKDLVRLMQPSAA